MFKSLEELRNNESLENLNKYYDESLGKNADEIKKLLSGYGVEVSDECAKECFEFCKGVKVIADEEMLEVAGGEGDSSVPERVRNCLNMAIKTLDDERRYNTAPILLVAKNCSQSLKDLLNRPFEREYFSQKLKEMMLFDIGLLVFSNTSLKFVVDCIQEARRSL